jgi:hypothetical protein
VGDRVKIFTGGNEGNREQKCFLHEEREVTEEDYE